MGTYEVHFSGQTNIGTVAIGDNALAIGNVTNVSKSDETFEVGIGSIVVLSDNTVCTVREIDMDSNSLTVEWDTGSSTIIDADDVWKLANCQWFAMCTNVAAVLIDHPILRKVPTCTRCAERVARDQSR